MKIAIVQPAYPKTGKVEESYATIKYVFDKLDKLEKSTDLVVLPESINVAGLSLKSEDWEFIQRNADEFLEKISYYAAIKNTYISACVIRTENKKIKNSTLLYDRKGNLVNVYEKVHLTANERKVLGIENGDSISVYEIDGIKFAFTTCFDIYFSEFYERIAAENVNVIIHSSYQRGELSDVIIKQGIARAIDANAFYVRSSYSMGEDSKYGGQSMIINPSGEVLLNVGQKVGVYYYSTDFSEKRKRNASFNQPILMDSRTILEKNRRPNVYRLAGPWIKPDNHKAPYPRVISHRGFNTIAPENTMPAFAAAVALGADEIELDVWPSRDGELIVCHDRTVDRTSNGKGLISELTCKEIMELDAGSWFDKRFEGLKYSTLEEILKTFAGQIIINLHIKSHNKAKSYDETLMKRIIRLIDKYQCRDYLYVAGAADVLETLVKIDDKIERCCLEGYNDFTMVDKAIFYKCRKLQFTSTFFNRDMIEKAHKNNIWCNLFESDVPEETIAYLQMGIDSILTNDLIKNMKAVRCFRSGRMEGNSSGV